LGFAKKEGIKKGVIVGVMQGLIWLYRFGSVALTFWYGGKLIREECLEPGIVLQASDNSFKRDSERSKRVSSLTQAAKVPHLYAH